MDEYSASITLTRRDLLKLGAGAVAAAPLITVTDLARLEVRGQLAVRRRRVGQYYNWTLDELLYAARAGFDGVCTNEHHQNAYGFMPSPNLMGSVLAKQTNPPGSSGRVAGDHHTLGVHPRLDAVSTCITLP
jgi:hypothetical protein